MITHFIELLFMFIWNVLQNLFHSRRRGTVIKSLPSPAEGVSLGTIVRSSFAPPPPAGAPTELMLTIEQKRRHLYFLGSTGSGKTTLLRKVMWADIEDGRGIGLIDARGELVDQVLLFLGSRYTPDELKGRLLLIDLRQTSSVPINPLAETATDAYTRVSFLISLFKTMFEIGVQTEQLLRNSLLALALSEETWSLYELEVFLTVPSFRARVLQSVKDATVLRFFVRFDQLASPSSWVEPCLNKISPWLSRPAIRNMVSQLSTISFHTLLDTRPDVIILVSLSADTLFGDAHLMGSLIIHSIVSAAMRPDRRDKKGNEFCLYLDEFENFDGLGDQFAAIISEGRKFGLCACLSHQTSIQLKPKLRNLIRNVVGTQIYFSVGGGESDTLAAEIASEEPKAIIKNLLMNQKPGECVVVRRGQPYTRIKTRLTPDPDVTEDRVNAIRHMALQHFGRTSEEIEAELAERENMLAAPILPVPQAKRTPRKSQPIPIEPVPTEPILLEVRDAEEPLPTKSRRGRKKNTPQA